MSAREALERLSDRVPATANAEREYEIVDAAVAENETLRAAHQRCCDETDYCYVCDNHPSHGHAKTCALAAVSARGGDAA
jgi:hypothetical protein